MTVLASSSSLKALCESGKLKCSVKFGDAHDAENTNAKANARKYLICGERCRLSLMLSFEDSSLVRDSLKGQIFGLLENYTVEREGTEKPLKVGLHRMRSVESLIESGSSDGISSRSSLDSPTKSPKSNDSVAGKSASATFVDDKTLCIPIEALVDSALNFERAKVTLNLIVFEEHPNDSLQRFLSESKMGARLLRNLLVNQDDATDEDGREGGRADQRNLEGQSMTIQTISTLQLTLPFYRPIQAGIRYLAKGEDSVRILLHLFINESLKDPLRLEAINLNISDPDSNSMRLTSPMFEHQLFRIEPCEAPTPSELCPKSTYEASFTATMLPFTNSRLKGCFKALKTHLDLSISILNAEGLSPITVSFESEADFSDIFPQFHSDQLMMTVNVVKEPIYLNEPFELCFFFRNGLHVDKDLLLSIPLEGIGSLDDKGEDASIEDAGYPFVSNETMLDLFLSDPERSCSAYVPLCRETVIGMLRPGESTSVNIKLLPIKQGKHWIKKLVLFDRIAENKQEIFKVICIHVLSNQQRST